MLCLVLGTPRDIARRSPKPGEKVDRKASHFSGVEYMAIRDRCEKIWRWHEGRNHQLVQEDRGARARDISEDT